MENARSVDLAFSDARKKSRTNRVGRGAWFAVAACEAAAAAAAAFMLFVAAAMCAACERGLLFAVRYSGRRGIALVRKGAILCSISTDRCRIRIERDSRLDTEYGDSEYGFEECNWWVVLGVEVRGLRCW